MLLSFIKRICGRKQVAKSIQTPILKATAKEILENEKSGRPHGSATRIAAAAHVVTHGFGAWGGGAGS